MKIHWNSLLAKIILPKKFIAITFGKHIFIRFTRFELSNSVRIRLLAHEEAHVKQYKRYGFIGFIIRYLWYSIRYSYKNNPLEIEAKQAENGRKQEVSL